MEPQRFIFLLCLITSLSTFQCYNSLHEEDSTPYHNNNNNSDAVSGYDSRAYPLYLSTIEEEGNEFEDLIALANEFSTLKGLSSTLAQTAINVDDFGAKGDGIDATEAFNKAWKVACSTTTGAVIVVPKNKIYLLRPIRFSGPCKSHITIEIQGTIEASEDRSHYSKDEKHWVVFDSVQNLLVEGGGTIDGNGKIWWDNSCKINKALPCKDAPTAVTFYKCQNLIVKNLKIKDAQKMHISFQKSLNVQASNLMITAPEKSPNTDGIHVTDTQNIQITSCVIGTGDDCISIVSGSQKVHAMDITCGPGHGISIGSLGSENSEAYVSDVVVNRAKLSGTTNGVRIKTWQGGSGSASNIKFQNIEMSNVTNPIIIDQNYCDQDKPCKQQNSAVQVENVVYQNIKGTSASDVAVRLDCSKNFPCQGVVLQDINIVGRGGGKLPKALCNNVKYAEIGVVHPICP